MSEKQAEDIKDLGNPIEELTDTEELKRIAIELWDLLDDIDLADDIYKSNDKLFREVAIEKAEQRYKYMRTDGQSLFVETKNKPS